mgnify:CR=1 FL=1
MEIDLNNYLYRTIKVKYQKLPKSLFELSSSADIKRWMRTYFPNTPVVDHLALRDRAIEKMNNLKKYWGSVADGEFRGLFNRKMEVRDYRVSGIGRSEFSEPIKEILRKTAFHDSLYSDIASAHNTMLPAKLRN